MNWLKKECEPYREMLSVMLDGELSEREQMQLKAHLAKCDDCSALCVALAAAEGLTGTTFEEPPPTLHALLMTRVRQESEKGWQHKLRRYLRPALVSAACVAVIVVGLLALRPGFGRSGSAASASDLGEAAARPEEYTSGAAVEQGAPQAPEAAPLPMPEEPAPKQYAAEEALDGDMAVYDAGAALASAAGAASGAGSPETAGTGQTATEKYAEEAAPAAAAAEDGAAAENGSAGAAETAVNTGNSGTDADAGADSAAASAGSSEGAEADTAGGRMMMSLELEVFSDAAEDGSFLGTIVSDSSGLLTPGATVTVRRNAEAEAETEAAAQPLRSGEHVRVWYNGLSMIPEGWMVEAGALERIE